MTSDRQIKILGLCGSLRRDSFNRAALRVAQELAAPSATIEIAEIGVTECEMVNQFKGSKTKPPQFTRGYGLTFGHCERKAMSMALVDRALRAEELGEARKAPAQDEEFVLYHTDNVEASGFVQHLKLPHYVDFQSELELIRGIRETAAQAVGDEDDDDARPAFGGGSV